MTTPSIMALGMLTLDLISELPHHPEPDSTNKVLSRHSSLGGQAGRAALAASRLGARTGMLSMIGSDPFASPLKEMAASECLSVRWFQGNGNSQISSILLVRGEGTRTTIASMAPPATQDYRTAAAEVAATAPFVLLDCSDADIVQTVQTHRHGLPTVVDTGSLKDPVLPFLRGLSHLVAPRNFLDSWLARNAPHLTGGGDAVQLDAVANHFECEVFVVTEGARGGAVWHQGRAWRFPAHPTEVVDSNGAGDVFHGGLVWALAEGHQLDLAIATAAWAAAMKCEGMANTTLPTARDAERFLAQNRTPRRSSIA